MSLRCVGSQLLQTPPSQLLIGASTASLSIWFRFNADPAPAVPAGVRLFGDDSGVVSVGLSPSGALRVGWTANDGSAASGSSWTQAILPGVAYHLAATWSNGHQSYYLNGLPTSSDTAGGTLGRLGDATSRRFNLGAAAGVDVTFGETTLWAGYALTPRDVLALRDRSQIPGSIAPASVVLDWTLSGPAALAAQIGDPGLTDTSPTGLSPAAFSGPTPLYQADALAFDRPAVSCEPMVCPSGQMLSFLFRDAATIPAPVASLSAQDEVQQILASGLAAGSSFTLALGDQVTAPIPVALLPPVAYFRWEFTLPAAGDYDIAVNFRYYINDPQYWMNQTLFEVLDSGAAAGSTSFTPDNLRTNQFQDGTTYLGSTVQLYWIPLGRFHFATTSGSVRLSGSAPGVGQLGSYGVADSLRLAAATGGAASYVGPDSPGSTYFGCNGPNYNAPNDRTAAGSYNLVAAGVGPRTALDHAATRAALEGLSAIGAGNVLVTGNGLSAISTDAPLVVSFVGPLHDRAIPLMVGSDPGLAVTRLSAGANWPRISINGGPPIELLNDFWGAQHGDLANPQVRNGNPPYLPYVCFALYQPAPTPQYQTLADGHATLGGNGVAEGTSGFGPKVLVSLYGDAVAKWSFPGLPPAQYRVSATWPTGPLTDSNGQPAVRSTDSVFQVKNRAGTVLASYHVDQSVAPSGAVDRGVPWQVLGTLTYAGVDDLDIQLLPPTAGNIIADSVRLERLSADDAIRISAGDVVTVTTGDGWAVTTAGPAIGQANVPMTNLVGATILPPIPEVPKTMGVAWNIDSQIVYSGHWINSNIAFGLDVYDGYRNVVTDSDGYPTKFTDGSTSGTASMIVDIVRQVPDQTAEKSGVPNFPVGTYALLWDGTSDVSLGSNYGSSVAEVGTPPTTFAATGNRRSFTVGPEIGGYSPAIALKFTSHSPNGDGTFAVDARNIRVYPPGIDPDNPPPFQPGFLAKVRPAQGLRFLAPLDPVFRGNVTWDDYQPPRTLARRGASRTTPVIRVLEIRAHDFASYPTYDPRDGMAFLVTTDGPHGMGEGFRFQFLTECGPIEVSTSAGVAPPQATIGQTNVANILSPTTFTFQSQLGLPYDPAGGGFVQNYPATMTNVVGDVGGTFAYQRGNQTSVAEIVDICNAAGADLHFNTCHSCDDNCLTQIGTYVAANLAPGLKLRLECSNETWNYGQPAALYFTRRTYSLGLGDGGSVPSYCRMAAHHWSLIGAAMSAAGRGGDLVRLLGTQLGSPARTSALATYCRDNGIGFDEMAYAPYLENAASYLAVPPGVEALPEHVEFADRLTVEQDIDMLELYSAYTGYERIPRGHRAALDQAGFTGVKLVTYEGGPEYLGFQQGGRPPARSVDRVHAIHRHPRIYHWLLRVLQQQQDEGVSLFTFFNLSDPDHDFGYGATAGLVPVWGAYLSTVGQEPGTGDPTVDAANILTPNRLDLVKSEVGGAFNHWASLVVPPTPPRTSPHRSVPGRNGKLRTSGYPRGLFRPTR